MEAVDEAWRERRDELLEQAGTLHDAIARSTEVAAAATPGDPSADVLGVAVAAVNAQFDARFGGFGTRAEVPAGDDARRSSSPKPSATPTPETLEIDHGVARRDGRRRHVRPGRRWLPPLLGRRLLARPPLREDALRPGAARPRLPARLARGRASRATAASSRRSSSTCSATCATPTAGSSRPRTPTPRASRASSTSGRSRRSRSCAAPTPPR